MCSLVSDSEVVIRFVLEKCHFERPKGVTVGVKVGLFLPCPKLEVSVIIKGDLTEGEIIEIGKETARRRQLTTEKSIELCGFAILKISNIRSLDLNVCHAPLNWNPHHANIINWPPYKIDYKEMKQTYKCIADNLRMTVNSQSDWVDLLN